MSTKFKSISSYFPEGSSYRHHGDPATANAMTHFSHPAFIPATASTPSSIYIPLTENSSSRRSSYERLCRAATKGDWDCAVDTLKSQPGAVRDRITEEADTLLHIAAKARQTKFVEEIVKWMTREDLELKNNSGNTALFNAASSGVTRIAQVMVQRNENFPGARNYEGYLPLHVAALRGHREMVRYLYGVRRDLERDDYVTLLITTINADLFDVAPEILKDQPELVTIRDRNKMTALHVLAQRPSAFPSSSSLTSGHRMLYQLPGTKLVHAKKLQHVQAVRLLEKIFDRLSSLEGFEIRELLTTPTNPLLDAAKFGIADVVTKFISSYPDTKWKIDQLRDIFYSSIKYRQVEIFKLIHSIGTHIKDEITSYVDENGQNILHLAGKLPPELLNDVPGADLQMQRQLLLFKEVEKAVPPLVKQKRDKSGKTPRMLFNEEHKLLAEMGEKCMKSRASSYMAVATLITTMMFAAFLAAPGWKDKMEGTPTFLKSKAFTTFAISDAFTLCSSLTSIFVFSSILTLPYTQEDFLEFLPNMLIVGLTTLFLSIISMHVAVSATFFIVLGCQEAWIVVPIALVASIPVTLYAFLQFPYWRICFVLAMA